MSASGYVHLDFVKIHKETAKAFLVELDDGEMTWLPRSQIADADDYSAGQENGSISITEWIAEQKGLG